MQFDMSVKTAQIPDLFRARKLDDALGLCRYALPGRKLTQQVGGGTLLFDAMVMGSDDVMSKVDRTKGVDRADGRSGYGKSSNAVGFDRSRAANRHDHLPRFISPIRIAYGLFREEWVRMAGPFCNAWRTKRAADFSR